MNKATEQVTADDLKAIREALKPKFNAEELRLINEALEEYAWDMAHPHKSSDRYKPVIEKVQRLAGKVASMILEQEKKEETK